MTPTTGLNSQDERWLREVIALSAQSRQAGHHPFAALLVDADGTTLARAMNASSADRTAHAEMNAIHAAAARHGAGLSGATLYSSAEPCAMCAGAMLNANIRTWVMGGRLRAVGRTDLAAAFGSFGMNFGISFQLVDDLLDLLSTEELMGKPVNNDVRAGVFTVPMLVTVQDAEGRHREHLLDLMGRAAADRAAADEFRGHVLAGRAVRATLDLIDRYNAMAREALSIVPADGTPVACPINGASDAVRSVGCWESSAMDSGMAQSAPTGKSRP